MKNAVWFWLVILCFLVLASEASAQTTVEYAPGEDARNTVKIQISAEDQRLLRAAGYGSQAALDGLIRDGIQHWFVNELTRDNSGIRGMIWDKVKPDAVSKGNAIVRSVADAQRKKEDEQREAANRAAVAQSNADKRAADKNASDVVTQTNENIKAIHGLICRDAALIERLSETVLKTLGSQVDAKFRTLEDRMRAIEDKLGIQRPAPSQDRSSGGKKGENGETTASPAKGVSAVEAPEQIDFKLDDDDRARLETLTTEAVIQKLVDRLEDLEIRLDVARARMKRAGTK